MKTKISVLLAIVALVTLSFTFANVSEPASANTQEAISSVSAPVGGIILEDVAK